MRYSTAGDSHGEAMVGILEGFPSGLTLDRAQIDRLLAARQEAFGRGERMKSFPDKAKILSGLSGDVTTGAPIAVMIENGNCATKEFDFYRPGHVDYVASVKYRLKPSIGAERASARETAVRTALGAIALQLLSALGITVECAEDDPDLCAAIERAERAGDTVGGKVRLTIKGLIAGIGSYTSAYRRLDAVLGGAFFSIPAVKAVENGLGVGFGCVTGRECADEFAMKDGSVVRTSNNCGGIEGGVSNGEDVVFCLTVKPIPSIAGLRTIDGTGKPTVTQKVRGDVCAVHSVCVVARAVAALEVASAVLDCVGGDTVDEVVKRYRAKAEVGSCRK